MAELEDSILHKIATAEGDITEDRALIEGLENTKELPMTSKKARLQQRRQSRSTLLAKNTG